MSVELGSVWIDNDSDLLVIVKSLEAKFDGKVTVIFNYIVRTGDKSIESASELELFLKTKAKLVRYADSDYEKGYEHGVQHMEMQNSIGKSLEVSDKLSLTEYEFESIIDEAFEEGYAQAYSELQAKTERERALQEKAWDEGYDQAIDSLIEAGVIGEDEEDYLDEEYSEYEFGYAEDNEEDGEEEYCFSKELDKILNGDSTLYAKTDGLERKHSHYFKDVRHLDYIDVYQVCKLFPVDDDSGAITHARKKLLVAGGRGAGKDMIKDITEARDTLNRYLQIEGIEE